MLRQKMLRSSRQPRRLLRTGSGFGTKTFRGISNVLRVLAFEETTERIGVATGSR